MGSEKRLEKQRKKHEARRRKEGRAHVVEYFHQVDDGYSHLAIQMLDKLKTQYDVELVVHIVPALRDDNFPEPDLLLDMSRQDASTITSYYQLDFPQHPCSPDKDTIDLATSVFCQLDSEQISTIGVQLSDCIWRHDKDTLRQMAQQYGAATEQQVTEALSKAAQRRAELEHYGGAMFWYEGEWYWGVDRLYHLEQRLRTLGALNTQGESLIAPRPDIATSFPVSASALTLEYYPSLRSP